MIDWREVVREYRYVHKKFKDPYKICVAAHKAVEELEKKIIELENTLTPHLIHKGDCNWIYEDYKGKCDCGALESL